MPTSIEQDIFRTVAFFSFFTYPLTAFEIWKWQLASERAWTFNEITNALDSSPWLKNFLAHKHGFYGVYWKTPLMEQQIEERHTRYQDALAKHKKMRRVLAYVTRLPWVEGVAVCNSLAFHHTEPRSDIDLFVLVKPGYLWVTRLFAVFPFLLLRQRPGEAKQHPVDMSFFLSRNAMNIAELQLDGGDPYLAFWTRALMPVYGDDALWQQWDNANRWSKQVFPCAMRKHTVKRMVRERVFSLPIVFPERWARRMQLARLPKEIAEHANRGTNIVINQIMLKFHKNDRREQIRAALHEAMTLCDG